MANTGERGTGGALLNSSQGRGGWEVQHGARVLVASAARGSVR
jgi:hypothetical protein